jgi:hypothetical protein
MQEELSHLDRGPGKSENEELSENVEKAQGSGHSPDKAGCPSDARPSLGHPALVAVSMFAQ